MAALRKPTPSGGLLLSQCIGPLGTAPRYANFHRLVSTLEAPAFKSPPSASPSPLSALPTGVLLRSLLVSTVSSKSYLLRPSLTVLSFLSRQTSFLLNVDRNPFIHWILKRTFYEQFCAGENGAEAKATIQQLKDMGFRGVIMTYAKETVFDHRTKTQAGHDISKLEPSSVNTTSDFCPNIETWRKGTLDTIDLLNEEDYLALKLTGAGPFVTEAFSAGELPPQQMMEALHEICIKCKDRGVRVLVDAESQHFQPGIQRTTLELMRAYNRDGYASVYNSYQAYLKNTSNILAKHLAAAQQDGFTLGLKLVRGAYIASDQRSLIHDIKEDTDNAYNSIAQGALKQELGDFGTEAGCPFPSVNLFLASHNKKSVVTAHRLYNSRVTAGLPTVPVRFAQLHGMSDEVSFSLLRMKDGSETPEVYKCSTWGGMGECLAYLLRRAIENRDAVSRTSDEYMALKAEVVRRIRGIFSASAS